MTISEQTVARTGRRMKTSDSMAWAPQSPEPARAGCCAGALSVTFTGAPSAIFWIPETMSRSPAFRPLSTT